MAVTADTAEAVPTTDPSDFEEGRTWRRLGRELLHTKKGMTGAVIVVVVLLVAITAPLISPHSPTAQTVSLAYASPSWSHPFGGDDLGRDVLARTLYGTRVSLAIGLLVVSIAVTLGSILGALAGYYGRVAELVIMRLTDFQLSFPFIVLAFIFLAIFGPGFWSVVIALCTALWVNYARVVRAETLKVRQLEFVAASRTIGSSDWRILLGHVLPNIVQSVIVLATLDVGYVIVFEASLTFLGLGIQPPTPTWGGMLSEGQEFLAQSPWMSLFPGAALIVTVLGINLLGDWLRDVLDPSLQIR